MHKIYRYGIYYTKKYEYLKKAAIWPVQTKNYSLLESTLIAEWIYFALSLIFTSPPLMGRTCRQGIFVLLIYAVDFLRFPINSPDTMSKAPITMYGWICT